MQGRWGVIYQNHTTCNTRKMFKILQASGVISLSLELIHNKLATSVAAVGKFSRYKVFVSLCRGY